MLCKKKFEGYGSKNRLPENTYVVPYRLMSYMNQFYENIIERISLTYSKHPEINIVQIIKDLEPVLMELDNTMMNSETIQDLDNENYKKR